MSENKIFKLIIVGGVAYGIYKLSGLMNLGNNLNVKVTNPRIHGVVANGVEFRCEVQLQNPTKDSLTLTQPYVKLLSKGQIIASSPVIDNTIQLKPMSQATTDTIKLQLTWLDIISVLRKLNISVPSFSISDISDNIMSLLKKMSLSIEYSTYANNVFYKDSENLTGTGSLGVTAIGHRDIKDGSKYDNLFPTPDFIDKVVNANASTMTDTLPEMGKVIRTYRKDTSRLAALLKTSILKDTLLKDWQFVYDHMQYKLDTRGREELRRPAVAWFHSRYSQNQHSPEDKLNIGVDCDCYTIFLCTLLLNQGIQPIVRVSDYGKGWQHVYPIVPNPQKKFYPLDKNTYYILDDVMEEFNTEKTFTKHKDFTMQELGIPLHVLHGINSDSDEKEISLLGLGMSRNPSETEIYDYLIKTRDVIKSNPDAIRAIEYPEGFLKMLNYAIENFNTPNRNKALEVLARNEAEINRLNGITYEDLDGLHGEDDFLNGISDTDNFEGVDGDDLPFDGLGKFFRNKEERKERKIKRKENRENKRNEHKERREKNRDERKNTKGFFRKINVGLKQGGQGFIRLNPAVIASRNGFLLALRLNMFRMSSRLKWAYATPEQAQKANISDEEYEAAKKSLEATEKMFVDKLGGTKTALKNSILSGKHGSIDGLGSIDNEEQNFYGLGLSDPVTVAMITAASVPIAYVVKTISANSKGKAGKEDTSTTDETETKDETKEETEETESTDGFGSIGDDVMELGEALELGLFKKKTKEEKEKEKEERLKKRKEKKEKKIKDKDEKKKLKKEKKNKKEEENKKQKQENQDEQDKEKSEDNNDSKGGSTFDTDTIVDATKSIFKKLKEKNKKRKLEEENIPDTNPDNNPDNTPQNNPQGEGVFKKIINVVKANPLITTLSIAGITYLVVPPVRKFVNSIFSPKKAAPKQEEVNGLSLTGTKQNKHHKNKQAHHEGKNKITAITLK